MANSVAEAVIGAVVLAAAAGFVVYAGQVRGTSVTGGSYPLTAKFRSAEGISVGTDVRLAGIKVGSVTHLALDPQSFEADATFALQNNIQLPDDSDVKIASEGLLGGNFVEVTPRRVRDHLRVGRPNPEHPRLGQPAEPADEVRRRRQQPMIRAALLAVALTAAGPAGAALGRRGREPRGHGPRPGDPPARPRQPQRHRPRPRGPRRRHPHLRPARGIHAEACRVPRDDPKGDAEAFLSIRDLREPAPRFSGWMFASSPALSALDHPRYDVWVVSCSIS